MSSQHSQGFSLLELMVVVAIIAILSAIALPAYSEFTNRGHVKACLQEAGVYVRARNAGVVGDVALPLPTYTPSSCASGSNLAPISSNELTGTATFTARDSASTQIGCTWENTRCSVN